MLYCLLWIVSGMKQRRRAILRSTESRLKKLPLSLLTHSILISMTRTHSANEHRYLIIGASREGRLLIVSYTERDDVVRLISGREVTSAERKAYEEG